MKKFNFEEALKYHNPQKVKWWENNYKKPISEEHYVKMMTALKKFSLAKRRLSSIYAPSALKKAFVKYPRLGCSGDSAGRHVCDE